MSVYVKYYYGQPGQTRILDATLANVTILKVTRGPFTMARTYNETVGNMQFDYSIPSGQIRFDANLPFSGPTDPTLPVSLTDLERVSVKYKV